MASLLSFSEIAALEIVRATSQIPSQRRRLKRFLLPKLYCIKFRKEDDTRRHFVSYNSPTIICRRALQNTTGWRQWWVGEADDSASYSALLARFSVATPILPSARPEPLGLKSTLFLRVSEFSFRP